MKNKNNISSITMMSLALIMLALSCSKNNQKEVTQQPDQTNLNSFRMSLNGDAWTPSVIDSCNRTFKCDMGKWGQDNFFRIEAYKDLSERAYYESRNYFELEIYKVNNTGEFLIDGRFRNLSNYARFTFNDKKVVYQNKEKSQAFKVTITQVFASASTFNVGIAGTFEGILYNIDNPADSIKIEKGEFIFKKPFSNSFNQCKD